MRMFRCSVVVLLSALALARGASVTSITECSPLRISTAWADVDGDEKIGVAEVIYILQKTAEFRN